MWSQCSSASGAPLTGGGVTLETVWHVRADASYDVVQHGSSGRQLIALRTVRGRGLVHRENGEILEAGPGSLMLIEYPRVWRYHCEGGLWHFWWFEFTLSGSPVFPLWRTLQIPQFRDEAGLCREVFVALRREVPAQRMQASAGLMWLMHRWHAGIREAEPQSVHHQTVERLIEAMHERADRLWRVSEMARMAGLSERRFRQVFETLTGQTPKRFHEGIRLELGRQLLRAAPIKLAEVADRTGFSSAFHFSRAFKHRFGCSPSLQSSRLSP